MSQVVVSSLGHGGEHPVVAPLLAVYRGRKRRGIGCPDAQGSLGYEGHRVVLLLAFSGGRDRVGNCVLGKEEWNVLLLVGGLRDRLI
jgi:hypothetical protein